MKYNLILLLLILHLVLINCKNVVVETEYGKVRGECLRVVTDDFEYVSFKGIPFAKPPVGELRFAAPQPLEPWSGVRNATQHAPVCIQLNVYTGRGITGKEDCLYLNVYTPSVNPGRLLPVMFYIHGGGYQSGSGNTERYGPDYLVPEHIVLVTANHRLGPFGFLCVDTKEVPGNAGMKDQVAAMRWVRNNIAKFGGDPNNVTIFGQSTGAASVGFHNMSPMTKGIYKRSIAMSGSPLTFFVWPFETKRIARRLAQQLGLWTRNDEELVKFLKSLPPESLLGTNPAVLRAEDPKIPLRQLIFTPVVEKDYGQERFLTTDPITALNTGQVHHVDLMIGRVTIEGIIRFLFGESKVPQMYTNYTELLVPRAILEYIPPVNMFRLADRIHEKYFGDRQIDNKVGKEFIKYISDSSFNYGISKFAKMYSIYRKTFVYKFSKLTNFPRYENLDNELGTIGAIHEDDLPFVLRPDYVTAVDKNSDDFIVVKTFSRLFANFAKYGDPTPSNMETKWPPYDTVGEYYMNIDTNLTVGNHLDADVISFWDKIYEDAGLGF